LPPVCAVSCPPARSAANPLRRRYPVMTHLWFVRYRLVLFLVVFWVAMPASAEWKEKVLYSFQGGTTDGSLPAGGVVFDSQGNLYGATTDGGPASCTPSGSACGMVFKLSPPAQKGDAWTETLIYQFLGEGSKDGSVPTGGLIFDATGNLYGVTAFGGTGDCVLEGIQAGCGTVFELSPPQQKGGDWTETILYSFRSGNDGYFPSGNLVFDKRGNLYGATEFGGGKGTNCNIIYGGQCGTVFKLNPPKEKGGAWTEKVLHKFKSGTDGANPNGGLVLDSKGTVYGTTYYGGNYSGSCRGLGCGTVFKLTPPIEEGGAWTENKIHVFKDNDGTNPAAGLTFDAKGYLYGTTFSGSTVFRLAPPSGNRASWTKTTLYAFNGCKNGCDPEGTLIFGGSSNLYGTTYSAQSVSGTVFRLKAPGQNGGAWTHKVLYGFAGPPDGAQPAAGLVFDKAGNLYSTTTSGGTGQSCYLGCGTVFKVSP
jgi:hypothetical protein